MTNNCLCLNSLFLFQVKQEQGDIKLVIILRWAAEMIFLFVLFVYQAELTSSECFSTQHNISCFFSNHLLAVLVFTLNCFLRLLFLYVAVSLREVAVLVPALPGEFHQWSALPRSTPSPTPLSRWACFVYDLCHAFFFFNLLTHFPAILSSLFINISC